MNANPMLLNPKPRMPKLHSLWLKALRPSFKYLFVFAHMRSGSSLLVHILNSNAQIVGYGEMKTLYRDEDSLGVLLSKVSLFFDKKRLSETYVLDKIVQDELFVDTNLLNRSDVMCIFLVRDAIQSLPSITDMYVNLFPKFHENWSGGEKEALEYYKTRLNRLLQLAKGNRSVNKPLLVTYDEILNKPTELFSLLHKSLGVENTFTEQYVLHKATGVPVIGDFSDTIKSGRIQKDKRPVERTVSPCLIEDGQETYLMTLLELKQYCVSLKSDQFDNDRQT